MSDHELHSPQALPSFDDGCALAAFGVVQMPFEEIAGLRKSREAWERFDLSASLLKHADHQTILALAALDKAISDFGWNERSFANWGVIAAPRSLGRIMLAAAFHKFDRLGVQGMSPLIIPTLSLHAVAGSLSLALKSHGFNFGVGGGCGHVGEALLVGIAALADAQVAGVWVVATSFDPEPVPDAEGINRAPATGHAVALALTVDEADWRLRAVEGTGKSSWGSDLVSLANYLNQTGAAPERWSCGIPGGPALEIARSLVPELK